MWGSYCHMWSSVLIMSASLVWVELRTQRNWWMPMGFCSLLCARMLLGFEGQGTLQSCTSDCGTGGLLGWLGKNIIPASGDIFVTIEYMAVQSKSEEPAVMGVPFHSENLDNSSCRSVIAYLRLSGAIPYLVALLLGAGCHHIRCFWGKPAISF